MSRAFVKEDETGKDDAQLNIPLEPFFATPDGISQWQKRLRTLEAMLVSLKDKPTPEVALEFNRTSREIALLNARLGLAKPSSPPPTDRVGFGSYVILEDEDGKSWAFHLVGSEEADPKIGAISCYSPLGKDLMGKSLDDTLTWRRQGQSHIMTITGLSSTVRHT